MFFDIPITTGASMFFWVVVVLVGLVNAALFIDNRNMNKKDSDS